MSDLLLPDKIQEQIQTSGITDLNLAESIASNFVPFMGEITEQTDKLKGLELGNAEHAAIAKRVNIDLGKIRSRKDEVKKKQKDYYLTVGRFIDSLANVNEGLIAMGQAEAQEHSKYFERMEAERIAKLKADRNEKMSQYSDVELPNLELLPEEVFQKVLANYKLAHEAKLKAEAEAEAKRIEDEKIEAERQATIKRREEEIKPFYNFFEVPAMQILGDLAEEDYQDRLSKAKKAKLDREAEQDRIRLENERLKKEQEKREEERITIEKLQSKRLSELLPYNGYGADVDMATLWTLTDKKYSEILSLKKAEKQKRDKEDQDRKEEEAKKQAELDRIQKELAAEKQRQADKEAAEKKDEEDRIKAEKELAMSGDKNRMKNWVDSFEIKSLDLKGFSPESLTTIKDIEEKFIKFTYWAKSEIEKL